MEYYDNIAEDAVYNESETESVVSTQYGKSASKKQKQKQKQKKKTTVSTPQFFKSNINGKRIVYGNTGISTSHVVGSADENLYFKVKISTGLIPNEPVTLFYDNPREYCVHYLTSICKNREKYKEEPPEIFIERVELMLSGMENIINRWQEKRNNYMSEKLQDAALRRNTSQKFVEIGGSNYAPAPTYE